MLEYSFYTENYGGKNIPEMDWTRVSLKAEQRLNSYTFGRLSGGWDGSEFVKLISCAVCEMSELFTQMRNVLARHQRITMVIPCLTRQGSP